MEAAGTIRIRGGIAVIGDSASPQDILIRGERIAAVGDLTNMHADVTVDAVGMIVIPGAVDTHVHFNDKFMNTVSVHDYYAGTRAAAFGGVTSIVDFSNQGPGEALVKTIDNKFEEAEGEALIDWGVHPVITQPTPGTVDEIPLVVERGAPTIKCYMTYREDGLMVGYDDLGRIMDRLRSVNGMLMVHAEDDEVLREHKQRNVNAGNLSSIYHARSRPQEAENRAIRRVIGIAQKTGSRVFIVHLATAEGIEMVAAARSRGIGVIAETCTHYLTFTEDMLEREDGIKWMCSPPLRDGKTQDVLWTGVEDGRISMVTSDDAAYSWEAKLKGENRFDTCPNGIPGIETRVSLLYSEGVTKGRISLSRFVELVSTNPARLFGLYPRKGALFPGADADIVLLDPDKKWTMGLQTLHMATDYSSYEGIEITGKIDKVFSRGELIIDGDECRASKGRGRYLQRRLDPSIRPSL